MRWGGRSDRSARNDERVGRRGGKGREGKERVGEIDAGNMSKN